MPWRKTMDPYEILVSEIMLQQTQVSRVIPKYLAFLKEFPTISSLTKAPRLKLLKAWVGLGYWRRALLLQNTARIIQNKYAEKFPQDLKTLETLPGIGRYTARALACFAFGNTEAFLDTNIRRVYLHFFFPLRRGSGQAKKVSDKEILKIAQKAVDAIRLRQGFGATKEWHYALFDYGATALKDRAINKRSRHYVKQSKFEGSFRSFRTKVMRFLLDQPNQKATANKIQRMLRKENSPYSSEKLFASLQKDSLIEKQGAFYSL